MTVKDRIKEYRKRRRISATALADMIGVTQPAISRYESGYVRQIPEDILVKISVALECTPDGLIQGDPLYVNMIGSEQRKQFYSAAEENEDDLILRCYHSFPSETRRMIRYFTKYCMQNAFDQ